MFWDKHCIIHESRPGTHLALGSKHCWPCSGHHIRCLLKNVRQLQQIRLTKGPPNHLQGRQEGASSWGLACELAQLSLFRIPAQCPSEQAGMRTSWHSSARRSLLPAPPSARWTPPTLCTCMPTGSLVPPGCSANPQGRQTAGSPARLRLTVIRSPADGPSIKSMAEPSTMGQGEHLRSTRLRGYGGQDFQLQTTWLGSSQAACTS